MPENDNIDYNGLFEEIEEIEEVDLTGDEILSLKDEESFGLDEEIAQTEKIENKIEDKKRTSEHFEKDMDVILITCESSMIIEGMRYLTMRDFSQKSLLIYLEAINGIELYIKILKRNPNNFNKLSEIINEDIDCRLVNRITKNIYRSTYNDDPETDDEILKSYEIFRDNLKNAYNKALISRSIASLKKYFLFSGNLDEEKVRRDIEKHDKELIKEIIKLNKLVKIANQLLKKGMGEIARGLKGKDMNIFIINATHLLHFYYSQTGNNEAANYYKQLKSTYKKYFVIR